MMNRKVGLAQSLMLLGLVSIAPALAQNAVGGAKKPGSLGGPTAQTNPAVPSSHHVSAASPSTHPTSPSLSQKNGTHR
ncbi:MAG: hypothetical protein JO141_03225 [Bradyrhizobium sp.]|nr:hypothetical protein [Bradyrhizobium sp.]